MLSAAVAVHLPESYGYTALILSGQCIVLAVFPTVRVLICRAVGARRI